MATVDNEPRIENVHKVKLRDYSGNIVTFDVTPDLIESRNVNYSSIEPIHAPGAISAYKNTSSRSFNISNIKLISRTQQEADLNLKRLWLLRSWCTPRFGASSTLNQNQASLRTIQSKNPGFVVETFDTTDFGTELLGAPPAVLYLSAYSRSSGSGKMQHINRVPTVIQQMSIPYPSDVDYIPTTNDVPMPTMMTLDITLMETHSPGEYERFSLDAFKTGNLRNF